MLEHYGLKPALKESWVSIALYYAGEGIIVYSAADVAASAELGNSLGGVHYGGYLAAELIEARVGDAYPHHYKAVLLFFDIDGVICLSHARFVVHSRESITEVGKVLALGEVLYIVLHSQELKTVGHRLQPVAVDVVIGIGVMVLQHQMTEEPVIEEQRIEIVHRRFKVLCQQCRKIIFLHIEGGSVLPAHHALAREYIRKLSVAVVPVLVKAEVEALNASYLPVEGSAYIHEFVECPALCQLLVKRVEQVPVIVLLLYSGAFQLLCIEVAVYAAGAIDAGIRLSELQRDMAVAGQRMTSNGQRFMALGQYLDLYKIENRMQVYRKNIELTERLISDIRSKQEQGMALRNDVTRYELQMENLRLGLRRLEDQHAILNHQLCNSLGLAQGTLILPDTNLVKTSVPISVREAEWQDIALTNSPQVEKSQIGTRLAQQQLKLTKSELLPKVALVAADNFSGPFIYDIPPLDKNINYWYVGVGLKYNLSSLFKSKKKIQQAALGVSRSQQQQTVVTEQLNNQVQQAYTLYEQSFVDLDTQRKSVQLAQQNYQVVSDRYLNQLALITDMLDASNIKLQAELQEVDACINIVYAYYKMKFIAGTL